MKLDKFIDKACLYLVLDQGLSMGKLAAENLAQAPVFESARALIGPSHFREQFRSMARREAARNALLLFVPSLILAIPMIFVSLGLLRAPAPSGPPIWW